MVLKRLRWKRPRWSALVFVPADGSSLVSFVSLISSCLVLVNKVPRVEGGCQLRINAEKSMSFVQDMIKRDRK